MSQQQQFQFDRAKFKELALYIATRSPPDRLGAVKYHKCLYYADMLNFVTRGHPLTGTTYRKRRLGPTSDHLPSVHRELVADGALEISDVPYFGFLKKEYRAKREPDLQRFSAEEIALIDDVILFVCQEHTAAGISEFSHNLAWEATAQGEVIPYYSAFLIIPEDVSDAAFDAASREASAIESAQARKPVEYPLFRSLHRRDVAVR